MNSIIVITSLLLLFSNQFSNYKTEDFCFSDLYFTSDDSPVGEEIKRDGLVGDDLTTGFGDAQLISFNTSFLEVYNSNYDSDYYCLNTGDSFVYANINIDISSSLKLYRSFGSVNCIMMNFANVSNNDILVFSPNSLYYIVLTNSNYIGFYNFSITPITINTSNYFVKADYNSNNRQFLRFSIFEKSYSSYPSSGTKQPSFSSTLVFDNNGTINPSTPYQTAYFANNYLTSGIFNSSNSHSSNTNTDYLYFDVDPSDDNRKVVAYETYPSTAVCYTSFSERSISSVHGATSFFVDNDYLMTAAHMVFSPNTNNFGTDYYVVPGQKSINSSLNSYHGNYCFHFAYFPLKFMCDSIYGLHNINDDWAIVKVFEKSAPASYFNHGFFGLSFNSTTNHEVSVYGYPQYYRYSSYGLSINLLNSDYNEVGVCMVSSGNIYSYSNHYRTYIDLTHGNSGGPAASFDANNNPFVKGIVSGAEDGFTQNALSKIKKENYYLLTDLLNNNL